MQLYTISRSREAKNAENQQKWTVKSGKMGLQNGKCRPIFAIICDKTNEKGALALLPPDGWWSDARVPFC